MEAIHEWFAVNKGWVWWLFAASLVVFLGSLIAVPWLVVRLPHDYFMRERRIRPLAPTKLPIRHPLVRAGLIVLKNLAGAVFLITGIAMLVLPGQGLLTIFIAMVLLDFPGKYRLERYIVSRPAVLGALNWLRRKRGRMPLDLGP